MRQGFVVRPEGNRGTLLTDWRAQDCTVHSPVGLRTNFIHPSLHCAFPLSTFWPSLLNLKPYLLHHTVHLSTLPPAPLSCFLSDHFSLPQSTQSCIDYPKRLDIPRCPLALTSPRRPGLCSRHLAFEMCACVGHYQH